MLRVAVARPVPPFCLPDGTGLEIDIVTAIGERLHTTVEFTSAADDHDVVIGCLTVPPEAARSPAFAAPYLITGQALAVDVVRHPGVRSVDDLSGLTVGVRDGDLGRQLAQTLVTQGRAAAVRVYDANLSAAADDLRSGRCDAFLTLAPVLGALVAPLPHVEVVLRKLSREPVAVAVPGDSAQVDTRLLGRIDAAQAELEADGTLQRIRRKWLGNPYVDQSLAAL